MLKKISLLLINVFGILIISFSQQLPITGQYLVNKFSLSPAFVGLSQHTESFLTYRQNWIGIKGAPTTAGIDINGPIKSNIGLGVSIYSENTGNFSHLYFSTALGFSFKLGENSVLSFSVDPKIYRHQLEMSNIQSYGLTVDPLIQNNNSIVAGTYDVGFATLLKLNSFVLGFYAPRTIAKPMYYYDDVATFHLQRHFIGHAGIDINLSNKFKIIPMAVVRMTQNGFYNYDASVLFEYDENLWFAGGLRAGNTFLTTIGGAVSDWFVVNYTYEFGIKNIASASGGTHEISLGFLFSRSKTPAEPSSFPKQSEASETNPEIEKIIKKLHKDLDTERTERKGDVENLNNKIKELEELIGATKPSVPDTVKVSKDEWIDFVNSDKILFGKGGTRLLSSSLSEISRYAQKLVDDPDLKILVIGHTDDIGSTEYNQKLSESRAKVIYEEMLKHPGVKSEQLSYKGMGEADPLYSNTTPENRRANNRIQFKFNKKVN